VKLPLKSALSLLISLFLIAGVAVIAYTGLYDLIETRFYNPSISGSISREVAKDTELIQDYLSELQNRFSSTLSDSSVSRSFLSNQSSSDIFARSRIFGILHESSAGLQSVRFVDNNGMRIHFSTFSPDIIRQDEYSAVYRNYNDDSSAMPFYQVQVPAQGDAKITMDDANDRIIFSFPFSDSMSVYRGTALFTVSVRAVAERLVNEGRLKFSEDVSLVNMPPGILVGSPGAQKTDIIEKVSLIWIENLLSHTTFESADSGYSYVLISARTGQGIFYGRLVDSALFLFPHTLKIIFLAAIFLTIYLIVFFLFNIKQDPMLVVKKRLKDLQITLIGHYYDRKSDMDWDHWTGELMLRREEIRAEVKRGLKTGKDGKAEELDSLINKSWDELLTVFGAGRKASSGIDEEKLKAIIGDIIQKLPGARFPGKTEAPAVQIPAAQTAAVEDVEELEVLEELEDAEEVEEVEGVGSLEEVGEVEDVGSLEEIEEVEELEELEELEALEEVEDVQAVELEEAEAIELKEVEETGTPGESERPNTDELVEIEMPFALEVLDGIAIPEKIEASVEFEPVEMTGGVDSFEGIEEFGDFEELEELEELETAGELPYAGEVAEEEETSSGEGKTGAHGLLAAASGKGGEAEPIMSREMEIDKLAREVEFGTYSEVEADEGDEIPEMDLEVVSPFSSLLSSLRDGSEKKSDGDVPAVPDTVDAAEEDELSIKKTKGGLLASVMERDSTTSSSIFEQDGVHFINAMLFDPDNEIDVQLNGNFKELVESVKRKPAKKPAGLLEKIISSKYGD